MKTKPLQVILFVIIALMSVQTFSFPSLDKLTADAAGFWEAKKFEAYTATYLAIEKEEKSFAASFNVALGLFRAGDNNLSLRKIEEIQREQKPTPAQVQRLAQLHKEVTAYISRITVAKKYYKGSALLSIPRDITVEQACNGRSANCLGLKPEQAADYVRELYRLALIANGYSVPVEDSSIQPE